MPHQTTVVAMILSMAASACGGSVSGDVATRYDRAKTIRWLAGTKVYLVPATAQNIAELGKGCDVAGDWYDRYRGERARLARTQTAHSDSAATAAKLRSENMGRRHAQIAAAYRDSLLGLLAVPPDDPDSLARTLSMYTAAIDDEGHYGFSNVRAGRYFVVTPGVGWAGADVGRFPVRLDLRIDRLKAACAVL